MSLIILEIVADYQFEDKSNHLAAASMHTTIITAVAHTAADIVIVGTVVEGIEVANTVAIDIAADTEVSTIAIAVT